MGNTAPVIQQVERTCHCAAPQHRSSLLSCLIATSDIFEGRRLPQPCWNGSCQHIQHQSNPNHSSLKSSRAYCAFTLPQDKNVRHMDVNTLQKLNNIVLAVQMQYYRKDLAGVREQGCPGLCAPGQSHPSQPLLEGKAPVQPLLSLIVPVNYIH